MAGSVVVTGGAGFIGSHLVDALVREKKRVTVIDNLSSGRKDFIAHHLRKPGFSFVKLDLRNAAAAERAFKKAKPDVVYHLAANPLVKVGADAKRSHLNHNVVVTYNVLEAMRASGAKAIAFSSTSTVYGNATVLPTPENYAPLLPVSIYGATKLSCEALVSAFSDNCGFKSVLFRFANVVGPRSTHGVISDFVAKLRKNPRQLEILGDGMQTKSYLHVEDCISAILLTVRKNNDFCQVYNIGTDSATNVKEIADITVSEMGLPVAGVRRVFTGGLAWAGDVKIMELDSSKIRSLGWRPKHSSNDAVRLAARSVVRQTG